MRKALYIFFGLLLLVSCNRMTPAGFWQGYEKEYLKVNLSSQGVRGGYRAMYWKGESNTFRLVDVLQFADEQGWSFADSRSFSSELVDAWTYSDKPVFPLSHEGFWITPSTTYLCFPRWIEGNLRVYSFRTGWVTFQPGTDEYIEDNGFVIVNADGSEMAVYHLWGE